MEYSILNRINDHLPLYLTIGLSILAIGGGLIYSVKEMFQSKSKPIQPKFTVYQLESILE